MKGYSDVALSHGNLLVRNVFFKKWKKLIANPYLAFGMFCVRTLETAGAVAGMLYSLIRQQH